MATCEWSGYEPADMSSLTGTGRVTNSVTATSVVLMPPLVGACADDSV